VDFNPLSTNPAGLQPKFYFLGCNFPVTTRQILTRLNILGCNLARIATRWVGNGLKSKIHMYGSFVIQNSTGLNKLGCNPFNPVEFSGYNPFGLQLFVINPK
jgi:hypothetical protein